MDKREKIEDFLWYGGNELFSTLMGGSMTRSVGIDRLVQLLQEYSDRCRRIKGRSGAYRFMLNKALKNNWLGKNSTDLNSHKLTKADREYIIKHLDAYISAGGRSRRILKKTVGIGAVMLAVGLFVFGIARYMRSKEYQQMLMDYLLTIENTKSSSDEIDFSISTNEGDIYLEHLPKLYYVTSNSETELAPLAENDISDIIVEKDDGGVEYFPDPRSVYSEIPNELCLTSEDYGVKFLPGTYRAVFVFTIKNTEGKDDTTLEIEKEIKVD